MLNSGLIDVVIGLSFLYFLLSVICSHVAEWIATMIGLRGLLLRSWVKRLLGATAPELWNDPAVKNTFLPGPWPAREPSYLAPSTFSLAFLNVVTHRRWQNARNAAGLAASAGHDGAGELARELVHQGSGSISDAFACIESWYSNSMDRVAGSYKRWSQLIIFVLAVALVTALNVDSIRIGQTLMANATLRQSIASGAVRLVSEGRTTTASSESRATTPTISDAVASILEVQGLLAAKASSIDNSQTHLVGLSLTVLAISLGAPFWFDTLGRLANMRSAGRTPESDGTQTKDEQPTSGAG